VVELTADRAGPTIYPGSRRAIEKAITLTTKRKLSVKVLSLTRHLRTFLQAAPRRQRYQVEQIVGQLRGDAETPEDPEVRRMIERLPTILREPGIRRRYEGFQRYFDVLPRIVFMYHRGEPISKIASELSFIGTDTGVETVVRITAQIVAERLNQIA
jgi:hypothetical protein